MRIILASVLLFATPLAAQQINPNNQINWTGSGAGQTIYAQSGDTVSSIEAECSSVCTYVVTSPQTITLSANHTLSSNVNLSFGAGGLWTVNGAGDTLTIPGHVDGALTKHFAGSASISFGKLQALANVEWFGAIGDWNGSTGTDNTTAIQACLNAITAGQCVLQSQSYKTTATLNITHSQVGLLGTAPGYPNASFWTPISPSEIITTSTTTDVLDLSGVSPSNTVMANMFTNFTLAYAAEPTVNVSCFKLNYSYGARIDGVAVQDCGGPAGGAGFNFHGVGSAGTGYIQNSAALWGFNGFGEASGSVVGFYIDSTDGIPSQSLRIRNDLAAANSNVGATTYGLYSLGTALNDLMTDHFETATTSYGEYIDSQTTGFGATTDIHFINSINDGCKITCITVSNATGAVEVSGGWNYRPGATTPDIKVINSSHVDITNLQLYFPTQGVGLAVSGSGSIRVSHNDFISGNDSAITFSNVQASTIVGNVMNGITATSIISLANSSANVVGLNTINGTATNGILIDSASNGTGGLETNAIGFGPLGTITNFVTNAGNNPTTFGQGTQTGYPSGSIYQIRQEVRMTGSPLCSAAANGSCTFTLTFPKAFPNTTWMGSCTAETSTGTGAVVSIFSGGKTTTTATATFRDFSGSTNALTVATCEGWD